MTTEAETKEKEQGGDSFHDTIRVVIHALILAVFVRIFLYQPFNIPSGSMIPTLLIGDYLFVSKFSYGYSKHSFPWSPNIFAGRVWSGEPKRGDVLVFKFPRDNSTDYIKRLIGLPGDKIQMIEGVLQINGKPVGMRKIEDFVGPGSTCDRHYVHELRVERFIETLPASDGSGKSVEHKILNCRNNSIADNTEVFNVPPGHYFMMGDNRDNSTDSRLDVGYVPAENLIGRADLLFFSVDENSSLFTPWRWPADIRWSRLLNVIR